MKQLGMFDAPLRFEGILWRKGSCRTFLTFLPYQWHQHRFWIAPIVDHGLDSLVTKIAIKEELGSRDRLDTLG